MNKKRMPLDGEELYDFIIENVLPEDEILLYDELVGDVPTSRNYEDDYEEVEFNNYEYQYDNSNVADDFCEFVAKNYPDKTYFTEKQALAVKDEFYNFLLDKYEDDAAEEAADNYVDDGPDPDDYYDDRDYDDDPYAYDPRYSEDGRY